ncbi:MAG TPA: sulfur carrier protein ThiS [Candidatus Angelobacter sp.]
MSSVKLSINGEPRDFPDGLTVASLVEQLGMKADRVAVELNLEIVPRSSWQATALKDGDKLEIVHFVGGGSGVDAAPAEGVEQRAAITTPSPAWTCPTCGRAGSGKFCPNCGEKKSDSDDLSLRHFFSHAVEALFNADSKIFRSFRALFTKPGYLSAEYVRGRRKPYLHPFQLFFVCNVIYFVLQPLTTWSGLRTYLPLHENSPYYGTLARQMVARHLSATGMSRAEFLPRFTHLLDLEAKSLVVLMVPLFAVVMLAMEWRKKRLFGEHMVFAFHFCAFWLISVFIVLYGGAAAVSRLLRHFGMVFSYFGYDFRIYLFGSIFVAIYLAKAFRTFYQDTLPTAIFKAIGLLASTLVVLQIYRFIQFVIALYFS